MPFITAEIWQQIKLIIDDTTDDNIIMADYHAASSKKTDLAEMQSAHAEVCNNIAKLQQ